MRLRRDNFHALTSHVCHNSSVPLPVLEDSLCCDGSASISPTFAIMSPPGSRYRPLQPVSLSEGSKIVHGRTALQDWLLQVWSHSVLLNLSLLAARTLSLLWRGKANPLPHHGNNEVIRAHDQDLAGSGAALQGRVRHAQVRREGLGVIDQLA